MSSVPSATRPQLIVFPCSDDVGRAQVAVAWFGLLADPGKARAVLAGRTYVSGDDIRAVAHPVLRHRIICNFAAEAEGMTSDKIIDQLVESIPRSEENLVGARA